MSAVEPQSGPGAGNPPAGHPPANRRPGRPAGVTGGLTELDWRRLHPVTPVIRGWTFFAVLLLIVGQQVTEVPEGQNLFQVVRWWQIVLALVIVGLIGLIYAALAWRMTAYAIDADSVRLHSGVVFRQQRNTRLDRLQAVDVVQPLLARFFGLAELKLEVAGGSGSATKLGFLKEDEANRLRRELLARAAGVRLAARTAAAGPAAAGPAAAALGPGAGGLPATGTVEGMEAPEAPEQPVTQVPVGRLVGSLVRSAAIIGLVAAVAIIVGVVVGTRDISAIIAALPMAVGFGGFIFTRFTREFGFNSAISPDGIRLRHGLLETRSQTIPPGRIQAIRLTQGPFWRGPDWWRVQVNVAGYVGSGDGTESNQVLLPVGSREDALTAVWLVLPDLGTADPAAVLTEGLTGVGPGAHFTASPRRAAWLDPVSWRRSGFTVTERALLARRGRFYRRLDIVPHERTQSLGIEQGPLQHRLRVATFTVHSTPGPVSPAVAHLDAADAAALMVEQAARARRARAEAGPELWMRRGEVPQ